MEDVSELTALAQCARLRHLNLAGNPCAPPPPPRSYALPDSLDPLVPLSSHSSSSAHMQRYVEYRRAVLRICPQLVILDGKRLPQEQLQHPFAPDLPSGRSSHNSSSSHSNSSSSSRIHSRRGVREANAREVLSL